MKKLIYLAIILLGMGIVSSCKGRQNQSSNSKVSVVEEDVKPIEKDWFDGQWVSLTKENKMIIDTDTYSDDYELMQFDANTKLYLLKPSVDYYLEINKEDIQTTVEIKKGTRFLAGVYDLEQYVPDPNNENHLFQFGYFSVDGASAMVIVNVYERVSKEVPTNFDSSWDGTWVTDEGNEELVISGSTIIIKNIMYGHPVFNTTCTIRDGQLWAALEGDSYIFDLHPENHTISGQGVEKFVLKK